MDRITLTDWHTNACMNVWAHSGDGVGLSLSRKYSTDAYLFFCHTSKSTKVEGRNTCYYGSSQCGWMLKKASLQRIYRYAVLACDAYGTLGPDN